MAGHIPASEEGVVDDICGLQLGLELKDTTAIILIKNKIKWAEAIKNCTIACL
jgi:hypothetical protein